MTPLRINGETRRLAANQPEYHPLSIRDEAVVLELEGGRKVEVNGMVAAFEPTPAELDALNRGAPLAVRILGTSWPPIAVFVGEPPR